jgi:hypothetical protein
MGSKLAIYTAVYTSTRLHTGSVELCCVKESADKRCLLDNACAPLKRAITPVTAASDVVTVQLKCKACWLRHKRNGEAHEHAEREA